MLHGRPAGISLVTLVLSVMFACTSGAAGDERIAREKLIEDVRQLADLVEEVHPDPYINGGGKIAFAQRLQEMIATIPEEGMTREAFYRHIRPFVASVGDAHTWLRNPYSVDYGQPGGVPLYFGVVEDALYVAATPKEHVGLIGARLVSVEGVPFDEIVARQGQAMGAENKWLLLRNLAGTGVLFSRCFLEPLLPEWQDKDKVRVVLRNADGQQKEHVLNVPKRMRYPLERPESKIKLPARKKCDFVYEFMDEGRKTALLVIDDMTGFREVFEYDRSTGQAINVDYARDVHNRATGAWLATGDVDELIAGIPSATETFRALVTEMKEAGTERLIVDLRRNDGGSSAMSDFLVYMLHGKQKLLELKRGRTEVRKLSKRYFDTHKKMSLGKVNKDKPIRLRKDDYDLGGAFYGRFGGDRPGAEAEFDELTSRMPTFGALCRTGEHDGYYCPKHVVVLCSPETFSSGWTLMYYLHMAGAKTVGTPSSQGPNCFGDIMSFDLEHSKLSGIVSQKRFEYFPDDPERGRVLMPDYPLTYAKLAGYDFDPDAELLHALEVLDELDRREVSQ